MSISEATKRKEVVRLLDRLRGYRPRTVKQLAAYVEAFCGLRIPQRRACAEHDSPLDYLAYSFITPTADDRLNRSVERTGRDCVVWANRGGGKTQLGAIASLLECVFLPGCEVRILGGSEDQSQRMYRYLRGAVARSFGDCVAGRITEQGCCFANGSGVEVLSQSERSVRGHHVQRLRCDEAELFDRDVYQAAQLITQSRCDIRAQLEVFSTMHRPGGLMHEIIDSAEDRRMQLFKWCLWEVIERCTDRHCSACCLWEDCRGTAKQADGYYSIDDAIDQKRRSSEHTWQSEMLCRQPNRRDLVFCEFNPAVHVGEVSYDPTRPLFRSIDFGFSNPFVCLYIQTDDDDNVYVIDEHVKSRTTLTEHARLMKQQYPGPVEQTYCDPAGRQHSDLTGTNLMQELNALGIAARCRSSRILDGIELIRNFLAPAYGRARLVVSGRCQGLISAFESLQYKRLRNGPLSELPDKDGINDHLIDALRYFFVNHYRPRYELREKKY